MKPYGVRIEEWPDVEDLRNMGSPSHSGRIAGRSGDFSCHSNRVKDAQRRYWKRRARRAGLAEIAEQTE